MKTSASTDSEATTDTTFVPWENVNRRLAAVSIAFLFFYSSSLYRLAWKLRPRTLAAYPTYFPTKANLHRPEGSYTPSSPRCCHAHRYFTDISRSSVHGTRYHDAGLPRCNTANRQPTLHARSSYEQSCSMFPTVVHSRAFASLDCLKSTPQTHMRQITRHTI